MKEVVYERPPAQVWDRATAELGADDHTIFVYQKQIYVPSGEPLTPNLYLHETVHLIQQKDDSDGWWERYFSDPQFRFDQEVEAYRAEYAYFSKLHKDRNERARIGRSLAAKLASPLYKTGNGLEAYRRITA